MFELGRPLVRDHWDAEGQISILPNYNQVRFQWIFSMFSFSQLSSSIWVVLINWIQLIYCQVWRTKRVQRPTYHGYRQDQAVGIPRFQDTSSDVWWLHQELPRTGVTLRYLVATFYQLLFRRCLPCTRAVCHTSGQGLPTVTWRTIIVLLMVTVGEFLRGSRFVGYWGKNLFSNLVILPSSQTKGCLLQIHIFSIICANRDAKIWPDLLNLTCTIYKLVKKPPMGWFMVNLNT